MPEPQVVITRKDKRIRHKLLHAAAFAVTGGASGVVTAAEAANHAGYNARTRKLQAPKPDAMATWRARRASRRATPLAEAFVKIRPDAEPFDPAANFRRDHVPSSAEYKAAHGE